MNDSRLPRIIRWEDPAPPTAGPSTRWPRTAPLLHAEDDDQFIGGASHGMGPVEVVEDWLRARADRIGGRHE